MGLQTAILAALNSTPCPALQDLRPLGEALRRYLVVLISGAKMGGTREKFKLVHCSSHIDVSLEDWVGCQPGFVLVIHKWRSSWIIVHVAEA